jgi:protein-S-isoprenylcysteine O-methyltransferase Ste14
MPKAQGLRVPRWAAFLTPPILITLAHAAAPAGLADLAPNFGWIDGRPSLWNLAALPLVVAGFAFLIWCLYEHFVHSPRMVELKGISPPYLLTAGPYQWSRNPMYVGGMVIWLGWTLFYGSLAVLLGMIVLWSAIAFLGVPREERTLEAKFGDTYAQYKRAVPRWLGMGHHRAS